MRVLIIGNGGREHALAWSLHRDPLVAGVYATRPNPGMASIAIDCGCDPMDGDALAAFAADGGVDLAIVGPEAPLAAGVADKLRARGVPVVGPSAAAARLEASKAFAKRCMEAAGVPTAAYRTFREVEPALAYVASAPHPLVVKANGLAAGKGVVIAADPAASAAAVRSILEEARFGDAGAEIVVEAFLEGEEASLIALCSGTDYALLPTSQDHKRLGDGDTGPNTGGMGAISPAPALERLDPAAVAAQTIAPVLRHLAAEGTPLVGFLYAGLMLTPSGPQVLEYNVRLGDPEAQALLSRLGPGWGDALRRAATGDALAGADLTPVVAASACVVVAAEGYPEAPVKGRPIEGLAAAGAVEGVQVFHAGTAARGEQVVSAGGRVLGVTAVGDGIAEALERAYAAVDRIALEGAQVRRDIGHHVVGRPPR